MSLSRKIVFNWLIVIVFLASIILSLIPLSQVSADDQRGISQSYYYELITLRTESSKTYYLGNNRYALQSELANNAIHYKNDYSNSGEMWKEIDLTIRNGKITSAPYILEIRSGELIYTDKKTGDTVRLKGNYSNLKPNNNGIVFTLVHGSTLEVEKSKADVKLSIREQSDADKVLPVEQQVGFVSIDDKSKKYFTRKVNSTIDVQVGASSDDAYEQVSTGTVYLTATSVILQSAVATSAQYYGGIRFTGAIPQSATISTAYITCYSYSTSYDDVNGNLHFEKQASPSTFTTDAYNITSRTRTTASTSWIADALGTGWVNSPSLVTPLQELVNAYTTTTIAVILRPNTDAAKYLRFYSYDQTGNVSGPKLYVEYSADVNPAVTTNAATNVEETTATYNANVTSLGSYSNIDQRGFAWGTTSNATTPGTGVAPPASYTSNWSETGSFSTGTYNYNVTGLPQADTTYVRAYTHNGTSWYWSDTEVSLFTKPAEPTNLVLTPGDTEIQVGWTKATGGTGTTIYTMVRYKTGAYPTDITDGNLTYNGTDITATQVGLVNGTTYYFRLWTWAYEGALGQWSDTYAEDTAIPVAVPSVTTVSSSSVEETTATCTGNITNLNGVASADMRGWEWGTTSGVYTGNVTESGAFGTGEYSLGGVGITQADTIYWRAKAHTVNGWGYGSENSFFTKPAEPTLLSFTAGDSQIQVNWTKATGGAGVTIYTMVRYKVGSYPTDITDGSLTYNGTAVTTTQAGLTNGVTYYFRLWTWAYEGALGQWSDTYLEGTSSPVSPPTVVTKYCSGFTQTKAVLNGEITSLGGVPHFDGYGFDYGLTNSYGSDETVTANIGLGSFGLTLDNLSPATPYHWRAKASYNGTWYYGTDATFSTKGSPVKYEYLDTGGANDGTDIYGTNWAYQTFTTNTTDIQHSITSIWLYMKRTGTSPGIITVSVKYTSNCTTLASCYCLPTGSDLTSGTFNGDAISTAFDWVEYTMASEVCLTANTTYAVVVKAPYGDNANYISWQETSTDSYPGGNLGNSSDSGITWTANCTADKLFQNWGNPCMEVISAKVFSSYINAGDWLIAIHYKNAYQPYYSEGYDVSSLFYLQLVDGTTVKAQTKVPAWGYRPGCIYLSADEVTPLTWGNGYRVRMYGNFSPYPYVDYTLSGTDWRGDDLTLLDAWVRSTAILMENYYGVTLTSYIAGKGITLNEDGGVVFSDGISELENIRPNLFQIVSTTPSQDVGSYEQANRPVWQVAWGEQITASLTQVGSLFNLDGQAIGAMIAFAFYAVVAALAFPGGTAAAAIGIPFIILIGAWATGFIAMAILGVVLSIAAFFLVYQLWIKGG